MTRLRDILDTLEQYLAGVLGGDIIQSVEGLLT